MINEDYCSFEVSKLLKEKGFNWRTQYVYTLDGTGSTPHKIGNWRAKSNIQKPTLQMAMKWLREVHDIYIVFFHTNKSGWWYNITDMKDSYVFYSSEKTMCSHEETVEAALKYVLENLI